MAPRLCSKQTLYALAPWLLGVLVLLTLMTSSVTCQSPVEASKVNMNSAIGGGGGGMYYPPPYYPPYYPSYPRIWYPPWYYPQPYMPYNAAT